MSMPCRRGADVFARAVLISLLLFLPAAVPAAAPGAETKPRLKNIIEPPEQRQSPSAPEKPAPPRVLGPTDDYDRGVPRTSIEGFLKSAQDGDYERAAHYLDLRNLPWWMRNMTGPELARQLKIVLDRTLWIDPELLSDDPRGHADDGLPPSRDLLGQVQTGEKKYTLLLQRVPRADGVSIWKISNATVEQVPDLYRQVGYGRLGEYLSGKLPDIEVLGAMLWQWVGLAALLALSFAAVLFPSWLAEFLLRRRKTRRADFAARFVRGPLRLLAWVLLFRAQIHLVSPTVAMKAVLRAETLLLVAVSWTVISLADVFIAYQAARIAQSGRTGAAVALQGPLRIMVRAGVAVVALLLWLQNLGFSVTAIIAGLGVGGIAVALASQRTFEDAIGAAVIFFSQPVRVGDFGRFGDTVGTVEEIGLHGTRIRTLEHTVLTISNSSLSRMPVENFTLREKIWYHPRISLPYDAPREGVRAVIRRMESLLRERPDIEAESARVRFTEIGPCALHLDVFAYVKLADYNRYLQVAEELNLEILKVVEQAGLRMAPPPPQQPCASSGPPGSRETER